MIEVRIRLYTAEQIQLLAGFMEQLTQSRAADALKVAGAHPIRRHPAQGPRAAELPEAVPEQAVPEQAVPEQAVPEQAVPEQAVPEQAVPEQAVPEQAAAEQAAAEQAAAEQAAAEQAAPEQAVATAVRAYLARHGIAATLERMATFGVRRVSEVTPEMRTAFLAAFRESVA